MWKISSIDTYLRPQMSQPRLQKIAPTRSPILAANERNGAEKFNSATTGDNMSPVISYILISYKKHRLIRNSTGQTLSL
jgi:hypothetical protein